MVKPSWSEVAALSALLFFALVMSGKLDVSNWSIVGLGSIATVVGVCVSLYQAYMARKEIATARALTEWSHVLAISSLLSRSERIANEVKNNSDLLCAEEINQIAREFNQLNLVVAGQPGMAILINVREAAYSLSQALKADQHNIDQFMDAALQTIKAHQQSLQMWHIATRRKLENLGVPIPGINA